MLNCEMGSQNLADPIRVLIPDSVELRHVLVNGSDPSIMPPVLLDDATHIRLYF